MKRFIFSTLLIYLGTLISNAQNFRADLKKLNAQIVASRKSGKLTETEYGKLMREQEIIKLAIDKAKADDIVTADEKNKIHSKIVRSRKRLAKYKTNREIY
jgi:3-hydroxymyristoyl/3-hydroxydecanoyl-(acyl carrier protein) dehydratase